MASSTSKKATLAVIPLLSRESVYVGVDIGKHDHVAGFVSTTLLTRHERFEGCPALRFPNSREGFRLLVDRIRSYVPLEQCFVLMEKTGHYHRALEEYLLDLDIAVHVMHVQTRAHGMLKSDKRDALGLANHLYNQLEKGIQVADKTQLVRRAVPASPAANQLHGLIRHRYELVRESTRRKNKLTAICDQLFPEFTQVFKDPNGATALAVRAAFATPHAVATASNTALCALRVGTLPSNAKLAALQELAATSIGLKDLARQRSLAFEQEQLIAELRLIQDHLAKLDAEIERIIAQSREGRILTSMHVIGPIQAATIISAIGSIENFPSAGDLKSYFGWAPKREQTGLTMDRTSLTRGHADDQAHDGLDRRQCHPDGLRMGAHLRAPGPDQMRLR
jgi:transposase